MELHSSNISKNEEIHKNCRMYEEQYPEVDQVVMVKVKRVADMGGYVTLLEYNNIEGMILMSELSRKRIRSVKKEINVNQEKVAVVLRVDKEKGYIDLSKRRVTPEDIKKMSEKYFKSKTVHSIMVHIAVNLEKRPVEELYKKVGWPLYKRFGHAYDAFKLALTEPDQVFGELIPPGKLRDVFLDVIRRRLTPKAVRVRAEIELTCFSYEGIDMIKSALRAGEKCGTEELPVVITLLAPPSYLLQLTTLDQELGVEILNKAINAVKEKINETGGTLVVKTAPRFVSDLDEEKLRHKILEIERQNTEVSGDDNSEDEELREQEETTESDDEDEDEVEENKN